MAIGPVMPPARGGRAMPVRAPRPAAPRIARPKQPSMDQQANQNAMSAFRTALAQLQSSTPQVDQAAIYAPYRASEAVTGQLSQGLQSALQQSGQAAQSQYGQALGTAQQQAAQFGISAGAGANPAALQNTGAAPLAQQTNAYASAAPQAAAQWQQLLERTAAAKVAGAQTDRNNLIAQGSANLSTALPTAIGNEKTRLFQAKTQRFNEGLARTQLTTKQQADMRNYGLDVAKVQQSGAVASTKAAQTAASLNERKRHDLATENTSAASVAIRARATQATAKGLKGVPAAVKALSGTAGTTGKGAYRGWTVQVQPVGSDGKPLGPVVEKHGPRKDWAPSGYRNVGGAVAAYDKNAAAGGTSAKGVSPAQWDQQMRALLAQNPGKGADIKAFLGPRPKAAKK